MRLWLISDLKSKHRTLKVPKNIDVVCFTGNTISSATTLYKKISEIDIRQTAAFLYWLDNLEVPHKIIVGGNTDLLLQKNYQQIDYSEYTTVTVLDNDYIMIKGLKFYGFPYHNYLSRTNAFKKGVDDLIEMYDGIDKDTDVLLTHVPPFGILDKEPVSTILSRNLGSIELLRRVYEIAPKVHAFGHVCDAKNLLNCGSYKDPNVGTIFINSACSIIGEPRKINNGVIIDIKNG